MKRKQRQKEKAGQGRKAFNRHLLLAIATKNIISGIFCFCFCFSRFFFWRFFPHELLLQLKSSSSNKNVWMKCMCDDVVVKFNIGKRLQIIVVGVLYHLHTHTKTIPPSHLLLCLLPQHINKAAAALRHSCTELLVSFTHTHTHTHTYIHTHTHSHFKSMTPYSPLSMYVTSSH
jgi:hypothetical protein